MLYDPRHDAPKPRTLAHFIAWLEQQPADTTYNFINGFDCLFERYLRAQRSWPDRFRVWWSSDVDLDAQIAVAGSEAAYFYIGNTLPYTYGDAIGRARFWAAVDAPVRTVASIVF